MKIANAILLVIVAAAITTFFSASAAAKEIDGSALFSKEANNPGEFTVSQPALGDVIIFSKTETTQTKEEKKVYAFKVEDFSNSKITFSINLRTRTVNKKNNAVMETSQKICDAYAPKCVLFEGNDARNKEFAFGANDEHELFAYYEDYGDGYGEITFKNKKIERPKCKTIIENGDKSKKINVVFLPGDAKSEGYGEYLDENEFTKDAKKLIDALFEVGYDRNGKEFEGGEKFDTPLAKYRRDFNFYYVWSKVPCRLNADLGENGEEEDDLIWNCDYFPSGICAGNDVFSVIVKKPFAEGRAATEKQRKRFEIARCSACGNRMIYTTDEPVGVFFHEFSHSPLGLADEYCCDGGYGERQPYTNIYEGGCARTKRLLKQTYGLTDVECDSFTSEDKTVWSKPSTYDVMRDTAYYHTFYSVIKKDFAAGGEKNKFYSEEFYSADNIALVNCVIKRARGEQC